jgi:hypothetical protein
MGRILYRRLRPYKYQLMREYTVIITLPREVKTPLFTDFINVQRRGKDDAWLTIKKGYAWDGASGPASDTPAIMRGSLVHDVFYQLMREKVLSQECRKYADLLLKIICLEDGMAPWYAWFVWRSVRAFGRKYARPRQKPKDEMIEAP